MPGPPKSASWQAELDAAIERCRPQMIEVRRHLHMHPEPSGQEHETSLYLYQLLSNRGLDVQIGPEGCGVVAQPAGAERRPRIALRADIDALRIADQKEVAYRSQRPGIMHACGHDAHTAASFGAVCALQELEAQNKLPWPVPWRAIFQPAEETGVGAQQMVAFGALQGIEAIVALHVDPMRDAGRIGLRPGVLTANCDTMRIVIRGRGGHAARPHESNDPIAAAAQLIGTVYLFVPRATDSQDAVVVTFGQLIGGDNPNVIPEQVELRGTLRTLDRAVRERTVDHIRQLARGIAEASGTQIDVTFEDRIDSVRNDPRLTELIARSASEVLAADGVESIPRPSMGSEDFAAYLEHVPGAMFRLGCAVPQAERTGLHTPTFDIDERALPIGAQILARTIIGWSETA